MDGATTYMAKRVVKGKVSSVTKGFGGDDDSPSRSHREIERERAAEVKRNITIVWDDINRLGCRCDCSERSWATVLAFSLSTEHIHTHARTSDGM